MSGLEGQDLRQYHLQSLLGQGGFAAVYRAVNQETGKVVAVKVLSPTVSGEKTFLRRFRREAELVSRLQHPHIVPVVDYDEYRNLVYLVMPHIPGGPLKRYLDGRKVPFEEFTTWFLQIADALEYAHSLGVLHRDVKPSNVLIDENHSACLADFGLARLAEAHSSLTGSAVLGTPAYMSPEQARSVEVGPATDQYALGAILYEIHTGRVPFQAQTAVDIILQHIEAIPPLPREFNPHIPEPIERIILTALEKDPEDRFGSVGSLKIAYERALAGDSLADLDITLTRVRERTSRRKWLSFLSIPEDEGRWLIGLALFALLLIAPLLYFGFGAGRVDAPQQAEPTAVSEGAAAQRPMVDRAAGTAQLQTSSPGGTSVVRSADCPGLAILDFGARGSEVSWIIDNGTDTHLELANLFDLKVPEPNQEVQAIYLRDEQIYRRADGENQPVWIDGANRTLSPGLTAPLMFVFDWAVEPTGYELTLEFNPDCTLSGTW